MNGLSASNFKRIHTGLVLELGLSVFMVFYMAALLVIANSQLNAAAIPSAEVTLEIMEKYAGPVTRLLYSNIILKYALSALCALITVSGLGEAESVSGHLHRSKLLFIALLMINAVTMVIRIISVSLFDMVPPPSEAPFDTARMAALILHCLAVHFLLNGYGDVLESIGSDLQLHVQKMNRHVILSMALLIFAYLYLFVLSICDSTPLILLLPLVVLFIVLDIYYVIVQICVLGCTKKMVCILTDISK